MENSLKRQQNLGKQPFGGKSTTLERCQEKGLAKKRILAWETGASHKVCSETESYICKETSQRTNSEESYLYPHTMPDTYSTPVCMVPLFNSL